MDEQNQANREVRVAAPRDKGKLKELKADKDTRNNTANHNASPSWQRPSLQSMLALTSVIVGISAVLLHLLGTAVHQAFLDAWGLDSGAFRYPQIGWLLTGDQLLAKGHLIDSSTSHMALFGVRAQRVRSVAREGLEVRATRWPGSLPTR